MKGALGTLKTSNARELANELCKLKNLIGLKSCGTDKSHIEEIAERFDN